MEDLNQLSRSRTGDWARMVNPSGAPSSLPSLSITALSVRDCNEVDVAALGVYLVDIYAANMPLKQCMVFRSECKFGDNISGDKSDTTQVHVIAVRS